MRCLALILIILLSPVFIIIGLTVSCSNVDYFLFKQQRIGIDKKPFIIYKFKSMKNNKVTLIGRIIRKLGLDELPQLFNILKGDMAFVGPRPLTLADIQRLNWDDYKAENRFKILPGITGLAQLTKICDARISLEKDLYYTKNKSFKLDCKLFFRSVLVPFIGKFTN